MLLVLAGCTTEGERARMRAGLDSINTRNRTEQSFTVQDVEPYVRFFDDHGTPNDQMLAHYLLGRAYYEHGEAPMALQSYHDALGCADTTAHDCDYAQLSRVYAQMAQVFYVQGLYRQQLSHEQLAVRYAWLGRDTLAALMCYEQEIFAYKNLNLQDSALFVIEDAASRYERYGYPKHSVIVLSYSISSLINTKKYRKAKQYMEQYESASGLFDSCGRIAAGHEIYYKVKGNYNKEIGLMDSAEYYYRKLLSEGKTDNEWYEGFKGLAELYQHLQQSDSVAKYYKCAHALLDTIYAQRCTQEVERIQALYDYGRHQEDASRERDRAFQRTVGIWICIAVIIFICLITYNVIRELSRKRHDAEEKYMQSQKSIEQAQRDIARLRSFEQVSKELISEKEQIIHEQETIMRSLLHHDGNSQSFAERMLKESDIYRRFEHMSFRGQQPTCEEWERIRQQIYLCYPGFKEFLTKHKIYINDKEYKTCLLIRIGLKPTIISTMLGVSSSYITELRAKMLQKLFGMSGSSKSFDKKLKDIF